jgi:NADPH:quinone reductase-like Zn-dependent oxidoreductase
MPLQIRSEVKSDNTFKMSLAEVDMPTPGDDEVVIRV